MERESLNTPPLEEDFFTWLAERKKVWRLQRLARKHGLPSMNALRGIGVGVGYPDKNYQHHIEQQGGGGAGGVGGAGGALENGQGQGGVAVAQSLEGGGSVS